MMEAATQHNRLFYFCAVNEVESSVSSTACSDHTGQH